MLNIERKQPKGKTFGSVKKSPKNFQLPQNFCKIDLKHLAYLPKMEQRLKKVSGILIGGISACTNIFIKSSTDYFMALYEVNVALFVVNAQFLLA